MIHSAKKSSKSTGRRPKSTETSGLLPTPRAGKLTPQSRPDFTPNLAYEIATSSQAVSPANPSLKLDEEKERQMTATSGRLCLNASLFTVHDGSSLKMLRDSLLGTTAWFSRQCALTWKKKDTKYNRSLYQLSPSVRRTDATASGLLLATPNTMDAMAPKTEKAVLREATVTRPGRTKFSNLRDQIDKGMMLPTVRAREGNMGELGSKGMEHNNKKGYLDGTLGTKTGLKLQPAFVEWMMGFPEGWTEIPDSKLLEMRLSRKSQKKL